MITCATMSRVARPSPSLVVVALTALVPLPRERERAVAPPREWPLGRSSSCAVAPASAGLSDRQLSKRVGAGASVLTDSAARAAASGSSTCLLALAQAGSSVARALGESDVVGVSPANDVRSGGGSKSGRASEGSEAW